MSEMKIPVICDKCGKFYGCGNGRVCDSCGEYPTCSFREVSPHLRGVPHRETCPTCLVPNVTVEDQQLAGIGAPALSPV